MGIGEGGILSQGFNEEQKSIFDIQKAFPLVRSAVEIARHKGLLKIAPHSLENQLNGNSDYKLL